MHAAWRIAEKMLDTHCVIVVHAVDAPVASGLPHRQNRQPEARPHATHEMRLLSAAQRGQSRGFGGRVAGAQVRGVLSVSVSRISGLGLSKPALCSHADYSDFSNILSKAAIERLAEMDEYEVVREVQVRSATFVDMIIPNLMQALKEHFADYSPLLPALFSLNHVPSSSRPLYGSTPNSWDPKALELAVRGITAVLLSLKKKPIIRYEKMSGMAKKLGVEIQVSVPFRGILSPY